MKSKEALEAMESPESNSGEDTTRDEGAESKPMPFGMIGITFLCNLMQYAVFLGFTMLALMLIRIFGPK
jgi:hypothetical protein